MKHYDESIDSARIVHDGGMPIYENGQPFPRLRGFFLKHEPLIPSELYPDQVRGDLHGAWRIYLVVCRSQTYAQASVAGWYRTEGFGNLDKMRKKLAKIIKREGLVLNMRTRVSGDWPGALYATVDGDMHGDVED